ncbi:MAG: hypothetical protein ACLR2E_01925 [Lachnospiraceae bacterium]
MRFISDRIGVIYKGTIVEVAEAEELFNFPLHPYTHSSDFCDPDSGPAAGEKQGALHL